MVGGYHDEAVGVMTTTVHWLREKCLNSGQKSALIDRI